MNKGIAVAGNLIVDKLHQIERYPSSGELTTVVEEPQVSTGGAACNVAMDLAALAGEMRVQVLGVMGKDENGAFIRSRFDKYPNIDCGSIVLEGQTSFTLVMNDAHSGQRTFFQYRGANELFDEEHIDWDKLDVSILHIGYILLLGALDAPDEEYGTKMARLLRRAQQKGIATSIDVVSESGDRFKRLVTPALRYSDYCVINELEAEQITGVKLRVGEKLLDENMPAALKSMREMGVARWAVIHSPEGGYGMDQTGEYITEGSLQLPKGYIKGTVGAGDAFCSGVLLGAYRGYPLRQSMRLGIASAACALSAPGSTEGMRPEAQAMQLFDIYNQR